MRFRGSGPRDGSLLTYRQNVFNLILSTYIHLKKKYSMHSCGVNKALNLIYEIYGPYFGDTGHIVKM